MASTKMKALISLTRFLVGVAVGYGIYFMWSSVRGFDPWYYAVGAGLISGVMAYALLEKLKGGGD